MSTRCLIGIRKNSRIKYIYCHHDGYPEGVGKVLKENYTTEEQIKALLDLGDISSLGTRPIANPNAWNEEYEMRVCRSAFSKTDRSLAEEYDTMCSCYKDRKGETNWKARTATSIKQFINSQPDAEYFYLFENGEWQIL